MSLDDVGLTHLDIIPKENNRTDPAGNLLPLWSWSYNNNINAHNKFKMVDVFFKAFWLKITFFVGEVAPSIAPILLYNPQ